LASFTGARAVADVCRRVLRTSAYKTLLGGGGGSTLLASFTGAGVQILTQRRQANALRIRQHTSAYGSIRLHTYARVQILTQQRQANALRIRQYTSAYAYAYAYVRSAHTSAYCQQILTQQRQANAKVIVKIMGGLGPNNTYADVC
jgi:hypothetical protein